jgi:hypothetical protein
MDLLTYFCDNNDLDSGVPGLEIAAILFRNSCLIDDAFPDLQVCFWLVGQLADSSYTRKTALLRCLCYFLSYVHYKDSLDNYRLLFAQLAPVLAETMTDGEICEMVFLCLYVMTWFVKRAICGISPPETFDSLDTLRKNLDDSPSDRETGIQKEMRTFIIERWVKLQNAREVLVRLAESGQISDPICPQIEDGRLRTVRFAPRVVRLNREANVDGEQPKGEENVDGEEQPNAEDATSLRNQAPIEVNNAESDPSFHLDSTHRLPDSDDEEEDYSYEEDDNEKEHCWSDEDSEEEDNWEGYEEEEECEESFL